MVYVKGGRFQMGSNLDNNEKPIHDVTVSSFVMGKYEVTQRQWKSIMGSNPSEFNDCPVCPVENVSWDDVQLFLQALNQRTGGHYRLPTEAEWEYAARGGQQTRQTEYAGSSSATEVGWIEKNSSYKTYPVGQKQPNELGLYDMTGNVEEW